MRNRMVICVRKAADIDYDKLAQAVVRAQEEAALRRESEKEEQNKQNIETEKAFCKKYRFPPVRFFVRVWKFLHAEESDGRFTSGWMAILLHMFFSIVGVCLGGIAILGVPAMVLAGLNMTWGTKQILDNLAALLMVGTFLLLCFVLSLFSFCTAREVKVEKDRGYLASVFSGIVSLVALVISGLALYYGLS